MGSRIRENVKHFFECFCEVVPPTGDKAAWIIQQYPDKYKDEEVLKAVPNFAYPYKFENTVIQHYSFVLTDLESKWTFGFCRHDPRGETAIVVLSYLPWHQAFYKFLDNIAVLMTSPRSEDLSEFLSAVYNTKLAEAGKYFTVPFNRGESNFSVEVPKPFQLPSIPENRNLTEYYNAVDSHNMMIIFASMLYERRIIFTSKKLKRLSACVQSANDVIYPMIWQHIFIPVLPMALIDYLLAPMPFLIGVPEEVMKKVQRHEIGEVVILDADANTVTTPFDDLNNLPQEVITSLKRQLKNKSALLGDGVSRAFLRALVQLIGGYRDGLRIQEAQKITFDQEKFIETRPVSFQPFLREMLHLQIFQQFIEERLAMLNNGLGFSDEFEMETFRYSVQSGSKLKQQYKDWTSTMKKEGSAFFKSVKEKANPAVKSAVKTVKDGGKGVKSAYRGLRSRLKENQGPQQLQNGLDSPSDKPRSAPNSPTGKRRTFAGISVPTTNHRKDTALSFKSSGFERSYSPLSPTSQPMSPDGLDNSRSGSPNLEFPRIDLMNEMKDLLQLRLDTPPVDRSLKPVRSLENFKQHTSPTSHSPDRWVFPSRTGAPMASPPKRFFLPNQPSSETQNLLLQSPDDVFSSPPVPPRVAAKDLFGTTPFVVAGGHSENGDPLFLVANQHSIDIVKLSPPTCSPRRKPEDMEDLIRLDSTSDTDDFDPLKTNSYSSSAPLSLSNPLYTYENHTTKQNGSVQNRNDQDLLQEYGLDFSFTSAPNQQIFDPFAGTSASNKVNSQSQWTRFD
ncbi:DENN domain-containing protein 1B isoform X1 [Tribolium castaneum]|uniref:DENN domain-containing protein 1A-like Protein n=1 Tax=Tribolium castaneum TaxID=7070 RepID=D7EJ88_TRICA|nr:PREDICTED: DENN domain-containing protein 1A isoform X1 [Tribolium castaneum]EFA12610.1 DENN domain-containing protein 1A-like Protein [Tribolium castaneum]|eukprot:XP_971310.1 PREDICTED: DENN domain-containing protein 1A isoform X1 [Tribolium castaneum]